MLNGKKILSVCGAVALLLGVGMNLRHSLNDYGMGTNSLSTFVLAQTSSSSGSGIQFIGEWMVLDIKRNGNRMYLFLKSYFEKYVNYFT